MNNYTCVQFSKFPVEDPGRDQSFEEVQVENTTASLPGGDDVSELHAGGIRIGL
jgi:hypothetical protein